MEDMAIMITPDMRVSELEKIIKSKGLHAQISCRIVNRRLPDASVSTWLLRDVYGIDDPHIASDTGEKAFTATKWDSILK